jgi:hypothetical protein
LHHVSPEAAKELHLSLFLNRKSEVFLPLFHGESSLFICSCAAETNRDISRSNKKNPQLSGQTAVPFH